MVRFRVERTIAAAPEPVFDWLADPANLAAAPAILRAGYANGSSGPGKGAVRSATCIGMWLREEYTAYDPPKSYSYLIVRAVPATNHEGGTLTLTPTEDGTHVDWATAYTHPVWAGGRALEAVTGPLIRRSFMAILDGCAKALENP